MKIVIAPDSFKESLSAVEVAASIEAGFREIFPDAAYVRLPMADGGEGTVQALVAATGGRLIEATVTGPLGEPVTVPFGMTGDETTAVIELAAASGLALVPLEQRNPLRTTTYGTGELIRAALDLGARRLLIGIGGSATCDGGAGLVQALGVQLHDRIGRQVGFGGGELVHLQRIVTSDLDPRLRTCRIEVACDVSSPLTGPNGAAAVFGPQKGATPEMVAVLEANLGHYARLIARDLGVRVDTVPGAGAAGGVGAALLAFLGAELQPGIDMVMAACGLDAELCAADLVITGEGRIDSQTVQGKVPVGVARLAKRYGKPVIAIAGSLGDGVETVYAHGIDAVFSTTPHPCPLAEALAQAAGNLRRTARNVAALIRLARMQPPC